MTAAIMRGMADEYRDALMKTMKFRCKDEGRCLVWQANGNSGGYPQQRVTTQGLSFTVSAHRLAYWLSGNKPAHQVSHLCHNKKCILLSHLTDELGGINTQRNCCALAGFCSKDHGDSTKDRPDCMVM